MKKQNKKKVVVSDFDQMADLVLGYVEYIHSLFPEQFPKLPLLLEAIESGEINDCTADLRGLLRDFQLTKDFPADVDRFIGLVKAANSSAAVEAEIAALVALDPISLKARKFVDTYGERGTWADVERVLAE